MWAKIRVTLQPSSFALQLRPVFEVRHFLEDADWQGGCCLWPMQLYLVFGWSWRILHWEVSRPNSCNYISLLWELTWYFQNVVWNSRRHHFVFPTLLMQGSTKLQNKKWRMQLLCAALVQSKSSNPVRHPSNLFKSSAGPRCSTAGGVEMKIRTHRGRRATITLGIIDIMTGCQTDLKVCEPWEPHVIPEG